MGDAIALTFIFTFLVCMGAVSIYLTHRVSRTTEDTQDAIVESAQRIVTALEKPLPTRAIDRTPIPVEIVGAHIPIPVVPVPRVRKKRKHK